MQRQYLKNMAMNEIILKHNFDNFSIDAKISFNDGEIIALFGDSGSGKSTMLKLIAGIIGDGKIPKKDLAFLFQDCTLFENYNVWQNLVYSNTKTLFDDILHIFNKFLDEDDKKYYEHLLLLAGLSDFKNVNVKNLSGGQRQRLALICALSKKAKYILLDEPLSALDDTNKIALIKLIKTLNKELNCSIILVSHSCFEINALAQKIYFVNNGRITKCLNKDEFYKEKILNNEFLCTI